MGHRNLLATSFSFSGILKGCLSHLMKPGKNKYLPDNWYFEINSNL